MIKKRRPYFYKISDKIPETFTLERMSAADFTYYLDTFLYENYRGAIDVVVDGFPFGSVNVALEGAAHLIAMILKEVFLAYRVNASIIQGQSSIKIKIVHYESLQMDYITQIAQKSGFSVSVEDEHTLVISAKVIPEPRPVIYAISAHKWRKILRSHILGE